MIVYEQGVEVTCSEESVVEFEVQQGHVRLCAAHTKESIISLLAFFGTIYDSTNALIRCMPKFNAGGGWNLQ